MTVHSLLLMALVFALLGVLPAWPHSKSWGYYPTWAVSGVIALVIILIAFGRI